MPLNKTEIESIEQLQLKKNSVELRKTLESMEGTKASRQSIALSILSLIPFFNKFIASASGAGNAITRMIEIQGLVNNATQTAASAFQYIKLGTAIIDFFRIPAIYVGALIAKQEVPFTFSRNAKFLYSSVILGLTITAVAFPPSAPIIALVAGIAALGQSVTTLANLYYKRYEVQDKLEQIEKDITQKKKKITSLIDKLEKLEKTAEMANDEELESIKDKITNKKKEIAKHLDELQSLYDSQEHCKQKLEKLGTTSALDRTVGVGFAALALIGIVTSMIFPPVGIGILATTASLGVAYFVGRITVPLMKSLVEKIINAVSKKTNSNNDHQASLELSVLGGKKALTHSNIPSAGIGMLAVPGSLGVAYIAARVTSPFMKSLMEKIINAIAKRTDADKDPRNSIEVSVPNIPLMFEDLVLINEAKKLANEFKEISGVHSRERVDLSQKLVEINTQALIANKITSKSDNNKGDQNEPENDEHLIFL
ncbi:coiled-coil protein [Legionella gratiana]|uniref:Coiled-coil protein n=1 Tax=Legionella gratiana TaxID=45066 RepID=A0A378IZT7_9GAMM|nr:hypothetical protein [Legionella gratiana]KTD11647.1 coiled-coil protein [Legionella gratiana]STX40994.1 coiled-coil protein [Legionella gratiana]